MIDINNLTKEQIKHLSEQICKEAYGFEGVETYSDCDVCMICLCKIEVKKL